MKVRFEDYPQHVGQLAQAALAAVEPGAAVRRHLQRQGDCLLVGESRYPLGRGRVFLVSVGKAAGAMGQAAVGLLGAALAAGTVITKRGGDDKSSDWPPAVQVYQASHPLPDEDSLRATTAVTDMVAQATTGDLVLCLISGGASALLTRPRVSLSAWRELHQALLACGCPIQELNIVRQALDRVKGGGLARLAAPAACASLILSDVVGNPLALIGSGPTAPVDNQAAAAHRILQRCGLARLVSAQGWQEIEAGLAAAGAETAGETPPVTNRVIGDVRQAAMAAVTRAAELGFTSHLLTTHLEGEAREVGRRVAALAKDAPAGTALILGGETTVTLGERYGLGGRNQELALSAAVNLAGRPGVVVATLATDGEDGPTEAAGAMVTGETVVKAQRLRLDSLAFLAGHDSYHFFQSIGGHLITGPTGTNVNDLVFVLKYEA
ncbi:MAG: DUF4147 domain-containing protein [Chloroflexota bacterium]